MNRQEVFGLAKRLSEVQQRNSEFIAQTVGYEDLQKRSPEGFTVCEHLRMWVWHLWSHHRDLVRARGCMEGDNPHFHVPHFIRQANEEFGRFIGELACLTDEQLDLRPPDSERTVREVVEHVIDSMTSYIPAQIRDACNTKDDEAQKA